MTRKRTPPPLIRSHDYNAGWADGYIAGESAAKTAHGSPGGRKGGRSTSEAKKRAARENGRKGGAAKKKSGTSPNVCGPFVHAAKKCAHNSVDKRAHTVLDFAHARATPPDAPRNAR